MGETITTRFLERRDIDSILGLLTAALGEPPLLKRTQELFSWKHFENPFGKSVALVAEAGGRLVGLRTLMRWDLATLDGETLHCVRAVDTATHPEFQRRGIFRRLTEEAIEEAHAQGVDLVFNTPNYKSGAGYRSMGWTEVGRVGVMLRLSPSLLSGKRAVGLPADPNLFLKEPSPVSSLSVEDRPPMGLRTRKTSAYLQWRFASHPTARYFRVEQKGSVAVVRPNIRNRRRELILADVFGSHRSAVMREVGRRSRADYVGAWFTPGSPDRSQAIRAGFWAIPGLTPLTLVARPLRTLDVEVSSMTSWDLSIGDLELL